MPRLSYKPLYRFLETIPAALVWGSFIGAIVLSFFKPLIAIYIIILFDLYWLIKAIYWLIYLFNSYKRFRRDTRIDWLSKLKAEDPISHDGRKSHWQDLYHIVFLPTFNRHFGISLKSLPNLIP